MCNEALMYTSIWNCCYIGMQECLYVKYGLVKVDRERKQVSKEHARFYHGINEWILLVWNVCQTEDLDIHSGHYGSLFSGVNPVEC